MIGAEQQKNTIRKNGVRITLWHDTILSNTIIPYYDYHFNIRTVSISYQKCLNFVLRCALLPRKPTIFIVEGKAFVLMEIQIQIKNCENCKAY